MRAISELARRQLGLITRTQALQLVKKWNLQHFVASGYLEPIRRGVFVVAGAPRTYEQAVLAALLAAGEQSWASHRTAARLHGLRVPSPVAIDVLTLPNVRVRLEGVAHHRNEVLPLRDLTRVGPVPVTSVAKTLVDCAPWLPGKRLTATIDDARRRKLVTYEEVALVHAELDKGPRTGRHLVVPLRPVVADRHDAGGSELELDVREVLRKAGLPLPVQQHPVFVAGRWRFLDHAYPPEKVFLEFDGFAEHGLIRETFDDDRERNAELALLGWLGIPCTSNTRPSDLVRRVRRALESRAA
jgi:hypothetical protein